MAQATNIVRRSMRKIMLTIIWLAAITGSAAAANPGGATLGFRDWLSGARQPSLGLLDPARLTVNHTASFGFASGGGNSLMQSLYATRFGYQLSNPVTLSLLLGVQNSQLAGKTPYNGSYNTVFGGMALDYNPKGAFHLHFEVAGSPFNTLSRLGSRTNLLPVTE